MFFNEVEKVQTGPFHAFLNLCTSFGIGSKTGDTGEEKVIDLQIFLLAVETQIRNGQFYRYFCALLATQNVSRLVPILLPDHAVYHHKVDISFIIVLQMSILCILSYANWDFLVNDFASFLVDLKVVREKIVTAIIQLDNVTQDGSVLKRGEGSLHNFLLNIRVVAVNPRVTGFERDREKPLVVCTL